MSNEGEGTTTKIFGGIVIRTLLSTPQEWHALVIGFFEILCPWKPRNTISQTYALAMAGEYHYYSAGRGAGFIALLGVILLFSWLIKEVLL